MPSLAPTYDHRRTVLDRLGKRQVAGAGELGSAPCLYTGPGVDDITHDAAAPAEGAAAGGKLVAVIAAQPVDALAR